MTFGQVLARGVAATNRSITALILLFLLYGIVEAWSLVIGGLTTPDFGMLTAFGCFSCFLMLVVVFAGPLVTAGAAGQLRDRIKRPGDAPGSFGDYAVRFYLPLLVLMLIFVVTVVVVYVIIGLGVAAMMFDEPGGFRMQPRQAQEFQASPLNTAAGAVGGLVAVTVAIVFNLANAIAVIEYMDAFTALGQAFGVVRRQFGDVVKLWVVTVFLALVLWGFFWIVHFGGIHSLPVLLVLGTVVGLYTPYALLLHLAWAVSLWLARKERPDNDHEVNRETDSDGTAESPDQPIGEFDL